MTTDENRRIWEIGARVLAFNKRILWLTKLYLLKKFKELFLSMKIGLQLTIFKCISRTFYCYTLQNWRIRSLYRTCSQLLLSYYRNVGHPHADCWPPYFIWTCNCCMESYWEILVTLTFSFKNFQANWEIFTSLTSSSLFEKRKGTVRFLL